MTDGGAPGVNLQAANGSSESNQTYCKKDGDWKEWGTAKVTGQGTRSDVLALRDKVLSGANDLELAMDDSTCRASASFARFTEVLRTRQREKVAHDALTARFEGHVHRPWQAEAVAHLDQYVLPPSEFVWTQSSSGQGCLLEFGLFEVHSFPY